jgi:hypothetical protein
MKKRNKYAGLRWTARIIGTLLVLFTIFIGTGEMMEGYHKHGKMFLETFSTLTIIEFILWFMGLAGLIWAWWKEGTGGFFSLICMVIFIILAMINPSSDLESVFVLIIALIIFLLPSVLFIIYWWLTQKSAQKAL